MSLPEFNVRCIEVFEKYSRFRSDNPLQDIWSSILKFSDISYLSLGWKGMPMDDYIYVSTCLNQAYEYYLASKTVSLKTRPELIYYSFLNLTKVALFINQDIKPPEYHGLSKSKSGIVINKSSDILNYSAQVGGGVFLTLAEYLNVDIKEKQVFTLSDFCNNAIELLGDYGDYFYPEIKVLVPIIEPWTTGVTYIKFTDLHLGLVPDLLERLKNLTNIFDDFEVFTGKAEESDETDKDSILLTLKSKGRINVTHLRDEACELLGKHFTFSVFNDGRYYLNLNEKEKSMPKILSYYGIMFLMSCIVRYEPVLLHNILDDKDVSVKWFVNKLCDISERVYPNLILNMIRNDTIKYSPSFAYPF